MRGIIHEVKRRNVHRVAIAYLVGSWLLVQILETVFPIYGFDESGIRWVILALIIGFIPVLGLSWAFEWSQSGIHSQADIDRDPDAQQSAGRTIDRIIIGVLSVAVMFFAADRFLLNPRASSTMAISRTIAVLPFTDMTSAQDQAYFGDGLAEELLNLLSKNPALRVAARTSSFSFRDAALPIGEIATQLGVEHILEGSVRRDGDRIRVTAQLISSDNGYHVWSETYDAAFSDIFSIQENISSQIAGALEASVLGEEPAPRQTDPEGYALFLQASHLGKQGSPEAYKEAIALYQQALAIDPGYAPALTNLSTVYANQAMHGLRDWDDAYREARDAALRAVTADPEHSGGYGQLSWIAQWYEGNLDLAIGHMKKALQLDPGNVELLGNAAVLLLHIGKLDASIAVQEYSARHSPVDPVAFYNLGLAYLYVDRLADAERSFRKVLQLSPGYDYATYQLGECLLLMGRFEEALQVFERLPDGFNRSRGQALANHALKRLAESDAALAALIEGWGEAWPSTVVHVHAYRGEIDEAFEWLEKEYEKFGSAGWGEWRLQRLFDNLRNDPRWTLFLDRVGVSEEQLSAYDFNVATPVN